MGKLPAFLFYPKDWLTDTELRICSKAAKGVWIDMLSVMFSAPNRGFLTLADGTPWTDEEISAAIGGLTPTNLECLAELLTKGVAHRDKREIFFPLRMVRDDHTRTDDKLRQRKHRKEVVLNESHTDVSEVVTPLSVTATATGN